MALKILAILRLGSLNTWEAEGIAKMLNLKLYPMYRCSISLVIETRASPTEKEKLENLKNYFSRGSLLESCEHLNHFSTFHIDWTEIQSGKTAISGNLKIVTQSFREMSHFRSKKQLIGQKCFIILGFKMLNGCDQEQFLSNWKEVSGLGNLLLFLSPKFGVKQAMLLQNMEPFHLVGDMFNYMVLVEVFYQKGMLIYLLDYVQRLMDGRNTGHVSVYQEMQIK